MPTYLLGAYACITRIRASYLWKMNDLFIYLTMDYSVSSMFPKATHETFSQKLYQTFKSHKRFIKPKLSRTDFAIAHYAGEVS